MTQAPHSSSGDVVGRGAEIEACRAAVARLDAGRGGTLLLSGEPGIGKSTLARLCVDFAAEQSVPAYWGFSWEAGGAPAYWPWTQVLGALQRDRDIEPGLLAPLAQIVAETSAVPEQPELQPDQARFRLLEATRTLFDSVASDAPIVVVLEDLHAADSETLHLLQYLARHAASMRLLLVGTFRETEARGSTDMGPLWQASRFASVLKLARLTEGDVHAFLEQQGDDSPDECEVRELLEITAGNPLFLHELTELRCCAPQSTSQRLPDTVQQVIRQQVELLPGATQRTLSLASVLGKDFTVESLSLLAGSDETSIAQALDPAVAAGIIDDSDILDRRFTHTLYRDVLYNDIGAVERTLLHDRYAQRLDELNEAGNENLLSLLATHLLLGAPENRDRAISALRRAAEFARSRLAFDEAASLLDRALTAFGDGPKADPAERCRLMIELANALAFKGEIEEGQRYCRQAFAIARTIEDPHLMSEVALAWGRAIVVAMVDRELIGALEECLDKLPADDQGVRALVLARLAAALQPALDPSGPMDMAREAIHLARDTGDQQCVFQVLRFAIAALMDFAPVEERIPLNREFLELARREEDVPSQFRSHLRLTVDASEAGDRGMLDESIAACNELAERIDLPHYRWRAASVRAMQATITGDFQRASALIAEAERYADEIDQVEATITLAIQRLALLVDWNSPDVMSLDEIQARLRTAYDNGLAEAEFYIAPVIGIHTNLGNREFARHFVGNQDLVARTFAGEDRYTLANLGVVALTAGRNDIAQRAYDVLIAHRAYCASLGLLGGCWCGPVHHWLGIIAHGLGNLDAAHEHFGAAMNIAERMRARPEIARIHASAAALAEDAGDSETATRHRRKFEALVRDLDLRPTRGVPDGLPDSATVSTSARVELSRDGDHWTVCYEGSSASVRDSKGIGMLARLLDAPDTDVHVLELVGVQTPVDGDAGPMLDAEAQKQYRQRVAELEEELEEAESMADIGRADALRQELDFIARELSRAVGLGGRNRAAGSAAERARVNVRRRITDAIARIEEHLPGAGRYLGSTVKTGAYCRFEPI